MSVGSTLGVVIGGDVPFLRVLLKMAIEDAGFTVIDEVMDRAELLDTCIRKKPDIVLLDLNLTHEESVRLIEDLLDIDTAVAIVAMADLEEGYGEKVLSAGARAFIQKPFSMYDLIDLIRKVAPDKRLRSSA
ncbi:MAG: response regulator [Candidatus Thorarchaeota archaeon]